jgi:hypothetical protein
MELKADGVSTEEMVGQPRPVIAPVLFFDPLLWRAALVMKGKNVRGRPCQVGSR